MRNNNQEYQEKNICRKRMLCPAESEVKIL